MLGFGATVLLIFVALVEKVVSLARSVGFCRVFTDVVDTHGRCFA